jgi:hypothetical protein
MSRPLKIQTESVTHAQPKKKTATDLPGRRIHSRGEEKSERALLLANFVR